MGLIKEFSTSFFRRCLSLPIVFFIKKPLNFVEISAPDKFLVVPSQLVFQLFSKIYLWISPFEVLSLS